MKIASAILLFTASLALGATQEGPSTKTAPNPSIGLEVDTPAPAFSLRDQFGREQTNQTLRGTNGTVILFFRSADW
jgi:cytochrome oxidase Cu insertion factor (SCO1/SenC/PrrC family)